MIPCDCYCCAIRRILPDFPLAQSCLRTRDEWEPEPTTLGGWDVAAPDYVSIEVAL